MADINDNDKSLSGDDRPHREYKGYAGWAERQSATAKDDQNEASSNGTTLWKLDKTKSGGAVQTYDQYSKSRAEESGVTAEWKSLDATSFIAKDIQDAINTIKDMVDTVLVFTKAATAAIDLLSQILKSKLNAIEILVNAIRDEIKDILDGLLGLGGIYGLVIEHNPKLGHGGVDHYTRTFQDSLKDERDARRPQFNDSASAHALFFMWGIPNLELFYALKKFGSFFSLEDPRMALVSAVVPPPDKFSLKKRFSSYAKEWLAEDHAYQGRNSNEARRFEGRIKRTSSTQKLHVALSWDLPKVYEYSFKGANTGEYYYTIESYDEVPPPKPDEAAMQAAAAKAEAAGTAAAAASGTEPDLFPATVEFQKTVTKLYYWVVFRSNKPGSLKGITAASPIVWYALAKGGFEAKNKPGAETTTVEVNGVAETVEIDGFTSAFVGRVFPGNDFYSDDNIEAPTKDQIARALENDGDKPTTNYDYKMLFVAQQLQYGVRMNRTGVDAAGTATYNVAHSNKEAQAKAVAARGKRTSGTINRYKEAATSRTIAKIEDLSADLFRDYFEKHCDPINPGMRVTVKNPTHFAKGQPATVDGFWVTSEFTELKQATNDTIKEPDANPPDWYSFRLIELIPELQQIIEEAKAYVDLVADSIIEGFKALVAYVESVLAQIKAYIRKLEELMKRIRNLLFVPLAGAHVLAISTNKGMSGLKSAYKKSFSKAPKFDPSAAAYPDEYLMFGPKYGVGNKIVDYTNPRTNQNIRGNLGDGQNQVNSDANAVTGTNSTTDTDHREDEAQLAKRRDAQGNEETGTSVAGDKPKNVKNTDGILKNTALKLTSVTGRGRKRQNGPTRDELVALGTPIYDKNHYTGGAVFITESISVYNALIRLLNLQAFIEKKGDAAKNSILGTKEFSSITLGNVLANRPKTAKQRQKERLASALAKRQAGLDKNNEDDDMKALQESLGTLDVPVFNDGAQIGPDGSQFVFSDLAEPFCLPDGPATFAMLVNGFNVQITLEGTDGTTKPCYSAALIAQKINEAYCQAVKAKHPQFTCAQLKDLATTADGKLLFKSPAASIGDTPLGDGSGSMTVSGGSFPLLTPGTTIKRIKLDDLKAVTPPFPVKAGDLIVEMAEYGVPPIDQIRSVPATYELNNFVNDPDFQDFSPSNKSLMIEVDALGMKTLDVTGNGGIYPYDASPSVTLPTDADFTFPLVLSRANNRFKLEIEGDFSPISVSVPVVIKNLSTVASATYDFLDAGVRVGDRVYFQKGAGALTNRTVEAVSKGSLTVVGIHAYSPDDTNVVITQVLRGGLPLVVHPTSVPSLSVFVEIEAEKLLSSTLMTFTTVSDFRAAVASGLVQAGITGDVVSTSVVDTSIAQDGTKGRVRLSLAGTWSIGTTTKLRVLNTGITGAGAAILSPTLPANFTLTDAQSKFRIKLIRGDLETASVWTTLTLATGAYTPTTLTAAVSAALVTAGITDVKARLVSDKIQFYYNIYDGLGAPLTTHFAYNDRVGLRLKGLGAPATGLSYSFTPGLSHPPVLTLPTTSNFKVFAGYRDKLTLAVSPTVVPRPAGDVTITLPTGTYMTVAELRAAVANGLTKSGFIDQTFIGTAVVGSALKMTLAPESSYLQESATLSVKARILAPARTAAVITTAQLRDYSYANVFAYIQLHKDTLDVNGNPIPFPAFETPAHNVFLPQSYTYTDNVGAVQTIYSYTGSWIVTTGVNDRFQMLLSSPVVVTGVPVDWATITVAAGTYASVATLVTAVQTAVNTAMTAGKITVGSVTVSGCASLTFTVASASQYGSFTTLSMRPYSESGVATPFFSFGSATTAAITLSGVGTGYLDFLEAANYENAGIPVANISASGEVDFVTKFGFFPVGTAVDPEDGLPYTEAYGVSSRDLLSYLECPPEEQLGTFRILYTLPEILQALNQFFGSQNLAYGNLGHINPVTGRLRLTGKVTGAAGRIKIIATEDKLIPGSTESASVAALLFGFSQARTSHIDLRGIGEKPTSMLLEVELADEDAKIVELGETTPLTVEKVDPELELEDVADTESGLIMELVPKVTY